MAVKYILKKSCNLFSHFVYFTRRIKGYKIWYHMVDKRGLKRAYCLMKICYIYFTKYSNTKY